MKQKTFVVIACVAVVLGLACQGFAANSERTSKQFVELRHYTFENAQQHKLLGIFAALSEMAVHCLSILLGSVERIKEKEQHEL